MNNFFHLEHSESCLSSEHHRWCQTKQVVFQHDFAFYYLRYHGCACMQTGIDEENYMIDAVLLKVKNKEIGYKNRGWVLNDEITRSLKDDKIDKKPMMEICYKYSNAVGKEYGLINNMTFDDYLLLQSTYKDNFIKFSEECKKKDLHPLIEKQARELFNFNDSIATYDNDLLSVQRIEQITKQIKHYAK